MNTSLDWLYKILVIMLAVISPIQPILIAVIFLVLVDFVTGIWASIKRQIPITSFHMRRTIVKLLAYLSTILVAFIIETYLLSEVPLVKVVSSLIGLTEGKSFLENINVITGIDFWQAILNKVQGKPLDLSSVKISEDKK